MFLYNTRAVDEKEKENKEKTMKILKTSLFFSSLIFGLEEFVRRLYYYTRQSFSDPRESSRF